MEKSERSKHQKLPCYALRGTLAYSAEGVNRDCPSSPAVSPVERPCRLPGPFRFGSGGVLPIAWSSKRVLLLLKRDRRYHVRYPITRSYGLVRGSGDNTLRHSQRGGAQEGFVHLLHLFVGLV